MTTVLIIVGCWALLIGLVLVALRNGARAEEATHSPAEVVDLGDYLNELEERRHRVHIRQTTQWRERL